MKFGLRFKVSMACFLYILLPLMIFLISFNILLKPFSKDSEGWGYLNLDLLCLDTFKEISKEYPLLSSDYEEFDKKVTPLLEKLGGDLTIIDNNGALLYSSNKKEGVSSYDKMDIEKTIGYDPLFERNNPGFYKHSYPIVKDNKLEATATIIKSTDRYYYGHGNKLSAYVTLSRVLSVVSLLIIIVIYIIYISRRILKPLQELSEAAEKIGDGNLDFAIKYRKNDEFGRFAKAFEIMRVKLKESIQKQMNYEASRKEMLGCLAHELRTPVSLITGYVEGIEIGIVKDGEKLKRYMSVIKEKTLALNRLIDDLFLFARLEVGKLSMQYEKKDSSELFRAIFNEIALEFENQTCRLITPDNIPQAYIKVDEVRMRQVVQNIIQNSKRYVNSTNGYIKIDFMLDKNFLILSFEDNGEGITPETLPHIFEPFYRDEKAGTREYNGAGLGLAICKYIVEEHGGNILAESIVGVGTIIKISISIEDKKI